MNVDPGEELFHLPLVVVGTLDNPPSLESFTGLAGTAGAGLAGYNLATSFGPFTSAGDVGYPIGLFLNTSGGSLTFDANFVDGDESTFTATTRVLERRACRCLAADCCLSLVCRASASATDVNQGQESGGLALGLGAKPLRLRHLGLHPFECRDFHVADDQLIDRTA